MLVFIVYRDSCLGLLEALACRSTTCDESFMSATIKNRCVAEEFGSLLASTFSGPMAWTIPAPSGFVFRTARGSSLPNGG